MQQSINIGAFPNDPVADDLRTSFGKCNHNFTELYGQNWGTGTVTSVALTMPSGFTVNGSPVTTTGTLAVTTSLNGIVKGNGSGLTTATAGTDYLTPTGDGSQLTGLTKAQVGLGNVENTALSTWAGTTNITTLGTITSGTWQGTTIGVQYGGTGLTSLAQGDLIYASAINNFAKLTKDTNATRYLSNTGTSNNPAWAQVNLANGSTGILAKTQGGAGDVSGILKANGSGTVSAAAAGTDYAPATSGTAILKGSGAGGFSNAAAGTDYQGIAQTGVAPPASTPTYIGQFYVDTSAQKLYFAKGTSSSADWVIAN